MLIRVCAAGIFETVFSIHGDTLSAREQIYVQYKTLSDLPLREYFSDVVTFRGNTCEYEFYPIQPRQHLTYCPSNTSKNLRS
jgi:hypothetical protein